MRTTLDREDRILAAARRRAAAEGKTLTAVIEEALAALLAPHRPAKRPYRRRWKTRKGRLIADVDIADREALFEAMDGRR